MWINKAEKVTARQIEYYYNPDYKNKDEHIYYGEIWDDEQCLLFIPRLLAHKIIIIVEALNNSKTWGEFKSTLAKDPSVLSEVMDFLEEYDELTIPSLETPFSADDIPGYSDGDYPAWPEQQMLYWVPPEIQEKYGYFEITTLSGDYLKFLLEDQDEIVAEFERLGYTCEKNQSIICSANQGKGC